MKTNTNGALSPKKDNGEFYFWFLSISMAAGFTGLIFYLLYLIMFE